MLQWLSPPQRRKGRIDRLRSVSRMVLREVAFARQGKLGIEFEADEGGGAPTVKQILRDGLASALPR